MVVLGTGITSAADDTGPDKQANPIGTGVTVPIDLGDTVLGQPRLPGHQDEVARRTAPESLAAQGKQRV
ncbi:hypothetical protein G3I59_25545 [Amycolatopsis rubida]|uniref:Uncharacterized protein n=1 Tax=Amycolatopsis rubida TaxID=112413 RepID=A0ABX0BV69_9PSEU|nr:MULTISPECIES: hypothetical protein [Amycolatopsis]MYW93880.1 hypothetical protein [Amycolatopsis rubida]NEC58869.1 hypothetical protein [Amycolatopsis rubida]